MLNLRSQILNLLTAVIEYQTTGPYATNTLIDHFERQLSTIFEDLRKITIEYSNYQWTEILQEEIAQLKLLEKPRTERTNSGKKSLLRQQLQRKGSVGNFDLDEMKERTIRIFSTLENLCTSQPQFSTSQLGPEDYSFLIETCRTERQQTGAAIDSKVTWILEFDSSINLLEKELRRLVSILSRLQQLQKQDIGSRSCSTLTITRTVEFNHKQEIQAHETGESCMRCNIF